MEVLFTAELEKCENWLTGQPNFRVLYVSHRDMINNAATEVQRINEFLDGGMDTEAMASTVDPTLYRNRNQ